MPLLAPVDEVGGLARPEALDVLGRLVVEERPGDEARLLEPLGRREVAVLEAVGLDGVAGAALIGQLVAAQGVRPALLGLAVLLVAAVLLGMLARLPLGRART